MLMPAKLIGKEVEEVEEYGICVKGNITLK